MRNIRILLTAFAVIVSAIFYIFSAFIVVDFYYFKYFSVTSEGIVTSIEIPETHSDRVPGKQNSPNNNIASNTDPKNITIEYPPHYQIDFQDRNQQQVRGVLVGEIGRPIYKTGDVVKFSYLNSNIQKLRQIELENPWRRVGIYLLIGFILSALCLRTSFKKRVSY